MPRLRGCACDNDTLPLELATGGPTNSTSGKPRVEAGEGWGWLDVGDVGSAMCSVLSLDRKLTPQRTECVMALPNGS